MKIDTVITAKKLQNRVLSWFDAHGRKDLPWQKNKTPYRVWVSEIMLQQTQVATVIPYYARFMKRFPKIEALAEATEDEVLHLWTGLGYYTRARNLLRTAQMVVQTYQGKFPDELEELESLPGIGRSTAGAILAIAFNKTATILDGNVKRVLTRLYGIETWPGEKDTMDFLWNLAEKFTPQQRIADYTQAMMDIGATVCVRGQPFCNLCPLEKYCRAHALGIEKSLPRAKPRKALPERQVTLLILQHQHYVLLEKRPPTGVWGGLWSLPETSTQPSRAELQKACQQRFHCELKQITLGEQFRHTFSHFHLDILPVVVNIKPPKTKIMEDSRQIWYNLHAPATIGLPAPIKFLLSKLS